MLGETASELLLSLLGHHLWQGVALAALLAGLMWTGRRFSSATRFWLAFVALVAIAALPLTAFAPRPDLDGIASRLRAWSTVEEPVAFSPGNVERSMQREPVKMADDAYTVAAVELPEVDTDNGTALLRGAPARVLATAFAFAWVAVVGWLLVRLVRAAAVARRLRRRSTPWESATGGLPPRVADTTGTKVDLRLSEDVRVPMVVGILRPSILVPAGFPSRFGAEDLEALVFHELAHVRRRDPALFLLQKLLEAIYFFHPAVRWVASRLDLEREASCDDWAVAATGRTRDYASSLIRVGESIYRGDRAALAVGSVRTRSQLVRRIERMLDRQRNHESSPTWKAIVALSVLCIGAAGTFSLAMPRVELSALLAAPPEPVAAPEPAPAADPEPVVAPAPPADIKPVIDPKTRIVYSEKMATGPAAAPKLAAAPAPAAPPQPEAGPTPAAEPRPVLAPRPAAEVPGKLAAPALPPEPAAAPEADEPRPRQRGQAAGGVRRGRLDALTP
jgi:beta-lactamase regulating signal transducer with metallopeptidase domain